jgi:hypothetical protein
VIALGLALAPLLTAPQEPDRAQALAGLRTSLDWLLTHQHEDGSWGHWTNPGPYDQFWSNLETHHSFQVATTALGAMALMDAGLGEREAAAVDRAVDYLARAADLKRPSDWDTDQVWGWGYGLCGLAQAAAHPRYRAEGQRARAHAIAMMGQRLLRRLDAYQTPSGGWAYYDEEVTAVPPMWATSFTTAVVLLGMLDAQRLGWPVDEQRLRIAARAVQRCRLPTGAYTYTVEAIPSPGSLQNIDQLKGSLSRIQSCNLALWLAARAGYAETTVQETELTRGLDDFFRDHRFLDVAYGRPHPHEAYYYNSGYFYFFGHYYAARVIEELPAAERAAYAPRLWQHVLKTQDRDGSSEDFKMNSHGRPYSTAFAAATLARTLGPVPAASNAETAGPDDR